jgi:radical SAM superfamily enzyme YgiQ (UPF0313 family)
MVYPNSTGNGKVPIGVVNIMTILKSAGHQVEMFDMTWYGVDLQHHDIHNRGRMLNFQPVDLEQWGVTYEYADMTKVESDLRDHINKFWPDVVGFSITEDTSLVGLSLAKVARRVKPRAYIIFGGVFCWVNPEFVVSHSEVDAVCIGEAEGMIEEFGRRWDAFEPMDDLPTMWIKRLSGEVVKNPIGPPADLNKVPVADLSLLDDRHFFNGMAGNVYKMTFVESQRGCPRKCTYCCNTLILNSYKDHMKLVLRKKDIDRCISEMVELVETHGINFIQFTDDDFTLWRLKELERFMRLYEERVGVPFWIQVEANHVTDEKIAMVRQAGCMSASMGIETGSYHICEKVFKRHTKREQTIEAFAIMHDHGIRTSGNIIIGVPYEWREEIFQTIQLARECLPTSLNVNVFAPYQGTELRDMAVELGYLDKDFIREGRRGGEAVLDMPQILKAEVEGLARTFVLYTYLPEARWPDIKKCEVVDPDQDLWDGLVAEYWEVAEKLGINIDWPGFDYARLLAERQAELVTA